MHILLKNDTLILSAQWDQTKKKDEQILDIYRSLKRSMLLKKYLFISLFMWILLKET